MSNPTQEDYVRAAERRIHDMWDANHDMRCDTAMPPLVATAILVELRTMYEVGRDAANEPPAPPFKIIQTDKCVCGHFASVHYSGTLWPKGCYGGDDGSGCDCLVFRSEADV